MKSSNLRLETISCGLFFVLAFTLVGCNGNSSPGALVATLPLRPSAVIVYDEAGDVALGVMPGAGSPMVYTIVMADGTTWHSQTLPQLEALWE